MIRIKKNLFWILVFCQFIAGCGGRLPEPVVIERPEDSSITCAKIEKELYLIKGSVSNLVSQSVENTQLDTFVGLVGSFFPPAHLLRDFRQADNVEINALRKRHNRIVRLAQQKGCGQNKFFLPVDKQCSDFYTMDCFLPSEGKDVE
ncbi:MAG: hypothetical protein HN472_02605 [Nitrospina sp.]|jgi:hypothetical protein|nr:hypothetical protein [Nitrospina sp.]MBT3921808.1 hypothetical protein [Nitrospina sp.]MBT6716335.1 hypothetical protein [Nitrospina sp.]MBT7708888.1 hypothetical protein [Nitrospina sp.]